MADTHEKQDERMNEDPPDEHIHPREEDEAEVVRSSSQTAQDRDHVIRGGDHSVTVTKEFPT